MCRRDVPAEGLAQAIGIEGKRTPGGYRWIELADTAGGAVARIDQRRLTQRALLFVIALKIWPAHVHLSAHLQHWRCVTNEAERYAMYGAYILRHVFTSLAITSGSRLSQHTVFIAQINCETIEFQFCNILHRHIDPGTQKTT